MTIKHHTIQSEWQPVKPGDTIDIIAPASASPAEDFNYLLGILRNWQLEPRVPPHLFGEDLLCANTDEQRFSMLKNALEAKDSNTIIVARGGYGCMRLLDMLEKIEKPSKQKLLIGMSDITSLQIYFLEKWGWPSLHAALSTKVGTHPENISDFKNILFGNSKEISYQLTPLNQIKNNNLLHSSVVGGNLAIVQTSLGTPWQLQTKNKILFLEEINERAYRVDRALQHLSHAGMLRDVDAVIFGDFLRGDEPDGSNLTADVLKRFAKNVSFPVFQHPNIGHGANNKPLPLATPATLNFSDFKLTVSTSFA